MGAVQPGRRQPGVDAGAVERGEEQEREEALGAQHELEGGDQVERAVAARPGGEELALLGLERAVGRADVGVEQPDRGDARVQR